MLLLWNPFLEFCLSTPAFSSIILFHMFIQAFNTLEIPEHCFGTLDTLKKVICLSISSALFLLCCKFHMNMNIQNSWLLWLSTYCWQFSTGNHSDFHAKWSANPRVTSILPTASISLCSISVAPLFFEVSISIFCMLIKPCQSLHTFCFWIIAV